MLRLFTAVAAVAFFAAPVLAQDVSGGSKSPDQSRIEEPSGQSGSVSGQGQTAETPSGPGSTSSDSMSSQTSPGYQGSKPSDCLPNDTRPECAPSQSQGQSPSGSMDQQLGRTPGEPGPSDLPRAGDLPSTSPTAPSREPSGMAK